MRRYAIAAAVLSLSLLPAAAAVAQRLRATSIIRVTTSKERVEGRFVGTDAEVLMMKAAGRPGIMVPRADVTQLEIRGSHAGDGAKVLGVTGLITGAAFGAMLVTGFCESSSGCEGDLPAGMGAFGVAFGAIGALGGAFIGSLIPKWNPIAASRIQPMLNAAPRLSVAPVIGTRGGSDREIGLRFALRQ